MEQNTLDGKHPTIDNSPPHFFLAFLNDEIDQIRKERQTPGWSIWAIYVALATTGWLLLDEFGKQAFPVLKIARLLLIISLLIDFWRSLGFIKPYPKPSIYRFQFSDKRLGSNRNLFLILILPSGYALCCLIVITIR